MSGNINPEVAVFAEQFEQFQMKNLSLIEDLVRSAEDNLGTLEEFLDDFAADLKSTLGAEAANAAGDNEDAQETALAAAEAWVTDNVSNGSLDARIAAVLWSEGVQAGAAAIRQAMSVPMPCVIRIVTEDFGLRSVADFDAVEIAPLGRVEGDLVSLVGEDDQDAEVFSVQLHLKTGGVTTHIDVAFDPSEPGAREAAYEKAKLYAIAAGDLIAWANPELSLAYILGEALDAEAVAIPAATDKPTEPEYQTVTLTEDAFFEKFKPIKNHISADNDAWNGAMFETFGAEVEFVQAQAKTAPETVWTIIETDGDFSITNGYHHVNRVGYLVTEIPADPNTFYDVRDPDDSDSDEDEND